MTCDASLFGPVVLCSSRSCRNWHISDNCICHRVVYFSRMGRKIIKCSCYPPEKCDVRNAISCSTDGGCYSETKPGGTIYGCFKSEFQMRLHCMQNLESLYCCDDSDFCNRLGSDGNIFVISI